MKTVIEYADGRRAEFPDMMPSFDVAPDGVVCDLLDHNLRVHEINLTGVKRVILEVDE